MWRLAQLAAASTRRRSQLWLDFLAALSGGSVSPDGTDKVAGLFDFGGLIASLTGHAEMTDQLIDSTPSDLVGSPEDPAGPQTKHIRVRQVIGTLTFSFSSANGQDKAETIGKVLENNIESDTGGFSPHNMYGLGLRHYADQTVDGGSSSNSETTGTPPDPSTFQADVQGTSTLETGDVVAGNVDNTKVCQVNNADPAQCQPQVVRWIVLPGRPTILTRPVTTNRDRDGAHGQDGDAGGRPRRAGSLGRGHVRSRRRGTRRDAACHRCRD